MLTLKGQQFSELQELCEHARYLIKHWQPASGKPSNKDRLGDGSEVSESPSPSVHQFSPAQDLATVRGFAETHFKGPVCYASRSSSGPNVMPRSASHQPRAAPIR
jgi:hypothetical protein